MKRPNAEIDRAISSALNDVAPERVSNWCAHIRTRQVGVSPLGQQVGAVQAQLDSQAGHPCV